MASSIKEQHKAHGDDARRSLSKLAALRILLTGESIIDVPSFWFCTHEDIDRFLRLSGFDTDNPLDLSRLWELHAEAITYLADVHGYRLPQEVEEPKTIHDVYLCASMAEDASVRRAGCITLKVIHILHHLMGRELVFNTNISEAQLFDRLGAKMFAVIDRMRATGIDVQEFAASKKGRQSLVTKLLAKRGNLASHVFDKVRFRIIVAQRRDIVRSLLYLLEHLLPFSYVVPEQSRNGIVTAEDIAEVLALPLDAVVAHWGRQEREDPMPAPMPSNIPSNEFSGATYRTVNFVAEIPMRVDDVAANATPAIVFVQAEIQVVDVATSRANEEGENAHTLYKNRQKARVRARLEADHQPGLRLT